MAEIVNGLIKVGLDVARQVNEYLKKHVPNYKQRPLCDGFTKLELSKVKSLTLENPWSCEGIEFLTNLESLDITTRLEQETNPRAIVSLTDMDMERIYKCKKLKNLAIRSQPNVTKIDLAQLPALECVDICNNLQLKSLTGLDKLSKLDMLKCYGNESLHSIPFLSDVIKKRDFFDLNLDIVLFPNAIGYNPASGLYDQKALDKLNSYWNDYSSDLVKWVQSFHTIDDAKHPGRSKNIEINQKQMIDLHNRACQILDENVPPNSGCRETILAVEKYLAEHVAYDHGSLTKNGSPHTHHVPFHDGISTIEGPVYGANGAYNCLMFDSCVCQGYSRGEQYLLALRGIRSTPVVCVGAPDTVGVADPRQNWDDIGKLSAARSLRPNHVILRIDDYYNLYSDPTWNRSRQKKTGMRHAFSLRTKKEISRDHTLLRFDRGIRNEDHAVTRWMIDNDLSSLDLFVKTKTAEVEAERKQIKRPGVRRVRGMVSLAR